MDGNDSDHPLTLHIHALSSAVDTLHARANHHALASDHAQSQSDLLSRQIAVLEQELASLRAHSSSLPATAESTLKINQLSLSLRTLNEKLELTENVLLERTRRLDQALADVSTAKSAIDGAYDLASRVRAREEEWLARLTDLQTKLLLEEEKSRLSDRVIQDYADLVRKLEGRSSLPTNTKDQHTPLERLTDKFNSEMSTLQHQLSTSQHDLSVLETELDAQIKTNEDLTSQLAQLQVGIDKRDRDDNTAAKMVARYMKFSQQSTNALQTTLTSLQSRHTSTLTSYTSQIHLLQHQIQTLTTSNQHLDLLRCQLSKEGFGRRWETRLRLQLLGREEKLLEDLKRWLRRSEERLTNELEEKTMMKTYLMEMIQDARIIIDKLDNPIHVELDDTALQQHQPVSGSLARFVAVQGTIHDLLERLHYEQGRRLELEELVRRDVAMIELDTGRLPDTTHIPVLSEDIIAKPEERLENDHLEIGLHHELDSEDRQDTPFLKNEEQNATDLTTTIEIDIEPPTPNYDNNSDLMENSTPMDIPSPLPEVENELDGVMEGLHHEPGAGLEDNHQDVLEIKEQQETELVTELVSSDLLEKSTSDDAVPPPIILVEQVELLEEEESRDTDAPEKVVVDTSIPDTGVSPPTLTPPTQSQQPSPHPLLEPLQRSRDRYTHIQHAFHDCHIALEKLKTHLNSSPPRTADGAATGNTNHKHDNNDNVPYDSLRTIVQRLDDYTEDVRVELEIRILDEGVLGRGYETLLMCPPPSLPNGASEGWNEEEILAFVEGTDPVIKKALKNFEGKLRDLEGDVAVIKKVVYSFDEDGEEGEEERSRNKKLVTSESLSTDPLVASPTHGGPGGWISSWISPSPSPLPSQLQGVSSSNSILRRTASSLGLASLHHNSNSDSLHDFSLHAMMAPGEVIKSLRLKTPMPDLLVASFNRENRVVGEDGSVGGGVPGSGMMTMIPAMSSFGSTATATPITASLRSASFALGMGMIGRGGSGSRVPGMGSSALMRDAVGRRRVVSTFAAAPPMRLKKVVHDVDEGGEEEKEDVD